MRDQRGALRVTGGIDAPEAAMEAAADDHQMSLVYPLVADTRGRATAACRISQQHPKSVGVAARSSVDIDHPPGDRRVRRQRRITIGIATGEQAETTGPFSKLTRMVTHAQPDGGLCACEKPGDIGNR